MIKHFRFSYHNLSGRFAVAVEGEIFRLQQIAGAAPHFKVLLPVLATMPDVVKQANGCAMRRQNPYAVEMRKGMSGAVNYVLKERRDDSLLNYPTRARLHISMYDKLNQDVELWLGDLVAILAHMIESGDFSSNDTPVLVEEVPTSTPPKWTEPRARLLTILDDGSISYDDLDGVEITPEMPVYLADIEQYLN